MSNTPLNADDKLREAINQRFDVVTTQGHHQSCGEYQTAVDDIMQLITADRKRVELEARIYEIKLTKDNSEESYLGEDWWADESIKDNSAHEVPLSYFENRIAELKAQQEEV